MSLYRLAHVRACNGDKSDSSRISPTRHLAFGQVSSHPASVLRHVSLSREGREFPVEPLDSLSCPCAMYVPTMQLTPLAVCLCKALFLQTAQFDVAKPLLGALTKLVLRKLTVLGIKFPSNANTMQIFVVKISGLRPMPNETQVLVNYSPAMVSSSSSSGSLGSCASWNCIASSM